MAKSKNKEYQNNKILVNKDEPRLNMIISSEPVRNAVFLFHGYGANADDLMTLATYFAIYNSNTAFILLNGILTDDSGNYCWFEIEDTTYDIWLDGLETAVQAVLPAIDQALNNWGLTHENLFLCGFSQGGMLALELGLYHIPCGGIICYSGHLVKNNKREPFKYNPDILWMHGDEDQVIMPETGEFDSKLLQEAGINCSFHLVPKSGHTVDMRSIVKGNEFLEKRLITDTLYC